MSAVEARAWNVSGETCEGSEFEVTVLAGSPGDAVMLAEEWVGCELDWASVVQADQPVLVDDSPPADVVGFNLG